LRFKVDKRFTAEPSPDRNGYIFVRNEQKIAVNSRKQMLSFVLMLKLHYRHKILDKRKKIEYKK